MEKPKNARRIVPDLTQLPRADFSTLAKPDLCALFAGIGEPRTEFEKKKRAADAAGLGAERFMHIEPAKRRYVYDLATAKKALAALVRLPEPDESFHCLMGGDYHGFDLVIAIQQLAGVTVESLHITTLGFNRHNMAHLCAMIDAGQIGNARILCSDYFAGADPETFSYARAELASRGSLLHATRNHSKLLLFAVGPRRYIVESSANLRSCNNLEQFSLCQSATLYDFHVEWIERIIAHAGA
jgi:hypothetical protein